MKTVAVLTGFVEAEKELFEERNGMINVIEISTLPLTLFEDHSSDEPCLSLRL